MVGKIVKLLNKEFQVVTQAALLLAVFTFGSQLLGLVRDRLLAGHIGPGIVLDTYVAAFKIPDLVFALAASLVSVAILVPFLIDRLAQDDGQASARKFLDSIFTVFSFGMIGVSLAMVVLMPVLAPIVVPGFPAEHLPQMVMVSRIMLLSPILLGFSNLLGTITQSLRRFSVYALAPILYNLGIVIGVLYLYPTLGLVGLGIGVVLGALLHALIQVPVARHAGLFPVFTRRIDWAEIGSIVRISVPRTFTLAFAQVIALVFVALASHLTPGSISIYNFAYVLQSVPFALIGMSYSVAAFPSLVRHVAEGDMEAFRKALLLAVRHILFWSLPVMVLFIVLRAQIVRVILGTGQFDWADTRLTAAALALFVLSVAAQGIIQLIIRAYYALGKTARPLVVNAIGAALTISFAFLFLRFFEIFPGFGIWFSNIMRVADIADTKILMLPLAYSVGVIVNAIILWVVFARTHLSEAWQSLWRVLVQSLLASLLLGVTSFTLLRVTDSWFSDERALGVLAHGALAGVVGLFVAGLGLYFLKNREIYMLLRAIRSRFWRGRVTLDELPR